MTTTSSRKLERFLAILGTAVCLVVSFVIWRVLSAQQSMWPLPDLYLLEMPAVSILGTWAIWGNELKPLSLRGTLIWVVVGILLGFAIIGAWSVGFLYIPVAGLLAIAAILSDHRQGYNLVIHMGAGLAAALAQAALMLTVIRLLY